MDIHPKVYQSRVANAKKTIAKMDPAVKAKLEKMYSSKKPKPKPSKLKGKDAVKEYQREISPRGVQAAERAAREAIEKKYPGMFIPETRTKPGIRKRK